MEKKKKRINIIDVLIIILCIIIIGGVALRFLLVKNAPEPEKLPDVEVQKYYVSYITRDHIYSVKDYLGDGEEFRFYLTNKPFGTVYGDPIIQNAQHRYFNSKGEYVTVYNYAEDDSAARWDITGTFIVEGKLNDDGVLAINDSESISVGLNKDVMIRSDFMVIQVYITDITPVEDKK